MARPRVVRNFATPAYLAQVDWNYWNYWKDRCQDFVASANRGDTTADRELESIVAGCHAVYGGPATEAERETQTTRNNLGALVRAGVCSVRRCRVCRLWFLSFEMRHALRVLCGQPACYKADARARARTSRRIERERQRDASRQVVPPRTR